MTFWAASVVAARPHQSSRMAVEAVATVSDLGGGSPQLSVPLVWV